MRRASRDAYVQKIDDGRGGRGPCLRSGGLRRRRQRRADGLGAAPSGDPRSDASAPTPVAVTVPDAMYLDAANMPMAGSMTIAAGESATNNGVIFSCPAGGDACEVEVAADGSVTSTGGEATAALSDAATMQVAQAKKAEADAKAAADEVLLSRIIGKDTALEGAHELARDGHGRYAAR